MNETDSEKREEKKSYDILQPWKTLDPWQQKYIETERNCFLLCGRQSGKTTAMSIKFGKRAAENPNRTVLMIAFTEKQAYALFFKTLMFLEANYPQMIKHGLEKPTQHQINLKNGSKIMCYAAGLAGEGIRTFTVTDLVVDEAAPMAREVFIAVTPMLSVTGGTMDVSSTPRGKAGYFYDCSKRDDFEKFYVSAEDCPRHKKEFLEMEKKNMTRLEYAQEYLAQFLDDIKQLFPDEVIIRCMTIPRSPLSQSGQVFSSPELTSGANYLGVDVGGMGDDPSIFFSLRKYSKTRCEQIDMEKTERTRITDVIDKIKTCEMRYRYHKVYIDDGGIGVGVFDSLLADSKFKYKVISINNASRELDDEGNKKARLMKIDLYMNLLGIMERGEIALWKDSEIFNSLKSIQIENDDGKTTIHGKDTHIAEALARAAYCMKEKSLKCFIY